MSDVADVVIVGGGIGGASLAYALARGGMGVTVLEASEVYEDRVRGESMQVWGLKEARELGVEQAFMDAGAHIAPVWKQYMEGFGDAGEIPMGMMVEGFDGTLNLRHPVACQALVDAAGGAGATVRRGVKNVKLGGGSTPTITYQAPDGDHEVEAQLVVGADGRASTIRKQAGITLERQDPISYIAGLLIEGLDDVPDHDVLCGHGELFFVMFHQGDGRARAYMCPGLSGQHRFSGPNGTQAFRDAARTMESYPWHDAVADATPIGPCATYPGDDTWTATPFADGVVVMGDAAGHNDPVIGQGLSIALRDARVLRDLILDGARSPADFGPYAEERLERMRRLRFAADLMAISQAEDADNRPARRAWIVERMAAFDPEIMGIMMGLFAGPENMPAEVIDDSLLERVRSAA